MIYISSSAELHPLLTIRVFFFFHHHTNFFQLVIYIPLCISLSRVVQRSQNHLLAATVRSQHPCSYYIHLFQRLYEAHRVAVN